MTSARPPRASRLHCDRAACCSSARRSLAATRCPRATSRGARPSTSRRCSPMRTAAPPRASTHVLGRSSRRCSTRRSLRSLERTTPCAPWCRRLRSEPCGLCAPCSGAALQAMVLPSLLQALVLHSLLCERRAVCVPPCMPQVGSGTEAVRSFWDVAEAFAPASRCVGGGRGGESGAQLLILRGAYVRIPHLTARPHGCRPPTLCVRCSLTCRACDAAGRV
jgi:hypothetical protein